MIGPRDAYNEAFRFEPQIEVESVMLVKSGLRLRYGSQMVNGSMTYLNPCSPPQDDGRILRVSICTTPLLNSTPTARQIYDLRRDHSSVDRRRR
jgi:hypothetical protein